MGASILYNSGCRYSARSQRKKQDKNQNIKDHPLNHCSKGTGKEKKLDSRTETTLRIQIHKRNFGFSI